VASTEELVEAVYRLIASSPPIPVTLMNHGVDETAAIIGTVVERCARGDIALIEIFIDPELAEFLGLANGRPLPHGSGPTVRCQAGYGVKCCFEKLEREPSVIARARRPWGIRVHPPLSMRAL
jgi:hypothetical protein